MGFRNAFIYGLIGVAIWIVVHFLFLSVPEIAKIQYFIIIVDLLMLVVLLYFIKTGWETLDRARDDH